jgi:hypothetical protein
MQMITPQSLKRLLSEGLVAMIPKDPDREIDTKTRAFEITAKGRAFISTVSSDGA